MIRKTVRAIGGSVPMMAFLAIIAFIFAWLTYSGGTWLGIIVKPFELFMLNFGAMVFSVLCLFVFIFEPAIERFKQRFDKLEKEKNGFK